MIQPHHTLRTAVLVMKINLKPSPAVPHTALHRCNIVCLTCSPQCASHNPTFLTACNLLWNLSSSELTALGSFQTQGH